MKTGEIYLFIAMGIGIVAVILAALFARWQSNKLSKK